MIEDIIDNAMTEGYLLERGSQVGTIKTKRGDVKVSLHDSKSQPYCHPFLNEIHLNKNRKNLVRDLMHEKGHFDILPYDFITYGILSLIPLSGGAYSLYQNSEDWKYSTLVLSSFTLAFTVLGIFGGVNLVSDSIIGIRDKLKLNRVRK